MRAWPQASRWSVTRRPISAASKCSGKYAGRQSAVASWRVMGRPRTGAFRSRSAPRTERVGPEELRLEHPAGGLGPVHLGVVVGPRHGPQPQRGGALEVGHDARTQRPR